ncbi:XshC-Cox1 family protein, partial [Streptomyces sp. SID5785]|uniref:XdhC family protein n=1 Tax=Streptomyces sp. SID5785 TaxID=2690309 RepID=UPI00136185B3
MTDDVIAQAAAWQAAGVRFATATVVGTHGSAPFPVGTSMLVGADGQIVGSVSGGCVEGAVCAAAEEVLAGASPVRAVYGVGADDAFAVGLTCGGTIEIAVCETYGDVPLGRVAADLAGRRPVALVTPTDGLGGLAVGAAGRSGSLGDAPLDAA